MKNNNSFHFNDTYFLDDDVPYSAYDGLEAAEIIIPKEYQASSDEESEKPGDSFAFSDEEKLRPAKKKTSLKQHIRDLPTLINTTCIYIDLLGETAISVIKYVYEKVYSVVSIPFIIIFSLFAKVFKKLIKLPKKIHISLADDIKKIIFELKAIFSAGKKVEKKKAKVILVALYKYFIISFERHRHFWKTIFNLALPCAALVLFVFFWNAEFSSSTFALEVIYNGQTLGYVKNADTFEEGRNQATTLLTANTGSDEESKPKVSQPVYKVKRIKVNELSSSSMISESIIANSDESYIRACGIYIDGEFLCAVLNESDAISVFDSILAPYKKDAAEGTIIGFIEEIEYVQGYYSENSDLIWDTATLKETISNPKTKRKYHKVTKKDTLSSIAKKYGLTVKQLKAMNPSVDFTDSASIKKLLVSQESNFVRVKVMKTRTKTQLIGYETIERNSSSLLKGTKKTTQQGSYGQKLITELVTYVDGKESYSTVVSERITKSPVNKIILIGTKTVSSSGGGYYGSSSGSRRFIWPTVGAYRISSYYGYRNPSISGWGFHGGIDIIRSGGYSTGTPVVASASGTVVSAVRGYSGYGHTVVINHGNGISTRYAHMQAGSLTVYVGQYVYQGQQIGRIGSTGNSTGPHLHFEVLVNGVKTNPLNYIR